MTGAPLSTGRNTDAGETMPVYRMPEMPAGPVLDRTHAAAILDRLISLAAPGGPCREMAVTHLAIELRTARELGAIDGHSSR